MDGAPNQFVQSPAERVLPAADDVDVDVALVAAAASDMSDTSGSYVLPTPDDDDAEPPLPSEGAAPLRCSTHSFIFNVCMCSRFL